MINECLVRLEKCLIIRDFSQNCQISLAILDCKGNCTEPHQKNILNNYNFLYDSLNFYFTIYSTTHCRHQANSSLRLQGMHMRAEY